MAACKPVGSNLYLKPTPIGTKTLPVVCQGAAKAGVARRRAARMAAMLFSYDVCDDISAARLKWTRKKLQTDERCVPFEFSVLQKKVNKWYSPAFWKSGLIQCNSFSVSLNKTSILSGPARDMWLWEKLKTRSLGFHQQNFVNLIFCMPFSAKLSTKKNCFQLQLAETDDKERKDVLIN